MDSTEDDAMSNPGVGIDDGDPLAVAIAQARLRCQHQWEERPGTNAGWVPLRCSVCGIEIARKG